MAENTKVVIVGAGHNGLVAAGYLGRAGTRDDVASMIVFLCSEEGQWISGQSINVDGGQVSSH